MQQLQFEFEFSKFDPFRDYTTETLEVMRDECADQLTAHRLWLERREFTYGLACVATWTPISAACCARLLYRVVRELRRREIIAQAGQKLTSLHYKLQLAQSFAA